MDSDNARQADKYIWKKEQQQFLSHLAVNRQCGFGGLCQHEPPNKGISTFHLCVKDY